MALYNLKNPAVKRLMKEAEELREPTDEYSAQPLEENLFEWHFTLRGPPSTDFDGGIYHGRITLPPEYPMKPPSIILLTPNGRFEVNKKICLSISGHHPETWQPSWSIRTALLAIIGFLPTHGNGAIGSLDYTPEERKSLAIKSQNWKCMECGYITNFLKVQKSEKNTELLDINSQQKFEGLVVKMSENKVNLPANKNRNDIQENSNKPTQLYLSLHLNDENQLTHSPRQMENNLPKSSTSEVSQPTLSDRVDLLLEEDFKQENKKNSKIEQEQSNGFENHVLIPQSASFEDIEVQESTLLPRNRHLTFDQPKNIKLVETKTVKSDKIKNPKTKDTNSVFNCCSLLMIWVIVSILIFFIARRVLF